MTNTQRLVLRRMTFRLPDGRPLLTELDETFDQRRTGLIGDNGCGKTVLAKILAGQLTPASGSVECQGTVFYLPQQIHVSPQLSVAQLAGAGDAVNALRRIECGTGSDDDLLNVDTHTRTSIALKAELNRCGLARLDASSSAAQLSGGECCRVALIGAWLSGADFLILDEPTNHLDIHQRRLLGEQISRWQGGLIAISHDRNLLNGMERIVALTPSGLRSYAGNFDFYQQCRERETDAAQRHLDHARQEKRRAETEQQRVNDKLMRRAAHGRKVAQHMNQNKNYVSSQRERSENTANRLRQQDATRRIERIEAVHHARAALVEPDPVVLIAPASPNHAGQSAFDLRDLLLPYGFLPRQPINATLRVGQRLGITGPNGCGKSTLLRVIAGTVRACSGFCDCRVTVASVDQQLTGWDLNQTALSVLQQQNTRLAESECRTRLALLGLKSDSLATRLENLSGGERLKLALACAIYADPPVSLLLLDEPTNHLDLRALKAVESIINQYPGAVAIVSHDESFLQRLNLQCRLTCEPVSGRWVWTEH